MPVPWLGTTAAMSDGSDSPIHWLQLPVRANGFAAQAGIRDRRSNVLRPDRAEEYGDSFPVATTIKMVEFPRQFIQNAGPQSNLSACVDRIAVAQGEV